MTKRASLATDAGMTDRIARLQLTQTRKRRREIAAGWYWLGGLVVACGFWVAAADYAVHL
jgi:hypothetical protein